MIGSGLLSFYLANFGHYDATYGSLGAAIALMIWMWMSTIVVLFGAELNSEIEHQTAEDSTVGAAKPIGSRGATMADTIGRERLRSSTWGMGAPPSVFAQRTTVPDLCRRPHSFWTHNGLNADIPTTC
jgi:hypothetical protein